MQRDLQFGTRENPASDRRHGSRLAVSAIANEIQVRQGKDASSLGLPDDGGPPGCPNTYCHAAPQQATTGGERPNESRLLTVHEVAELLHVPTSWVYSRTRKRSLERLPGYRLGKYWRFRESEVLDWVRLHCGGRGAS